VVALEPSTSPLAAVQYADEFAAADPPVTVAAPDDLVVVVADGPEVRAAETLDTAADASSSSSPHATDKRATMPVTAASCSA
jgi:hypothetical protein